VYLCVCVYVCVMCVLWWPRTPGPSAGLPAGAAARPAPPAQPPCRRHRPPQFSLAHPTHRHDMRAATGWPSAERVACAAVQMQSQDAQDAVDELLLADEDDLVQCVAVPSFPRSLLCRVPALRVEW
jgi:hypothetical protein